MQEIWYLITGHGRLWWRQQPICTNCCRQVLNTVVLSFRRAFRLLFIIFILPLFSSFQEIQGHRQFVRNRRPRIHGQTPSKALDSLVVLLQIEMYETQPVPSLNVGAIQRQGFPCGFQCLRVVTQKELACGGLVPSFRIVRIHVLHNLLIFGQGMYRR